MPGAIKGLFRAAVKAVTHRAEDEPPPPARRRGGETGKGFVRAWRAVLHRAAMKTGAAARGRYAALRLAKADLSTEALAKVEPEAFTPADAYARTGMYLSDTLDWLNLWQDNANNEPWSDCDFNAKQDHDFPQP